MLLGLSPLLSPDLLHALASMGHGDELVIADANFPAANFAQRLVRLPGLDGESVHNAVLSVLPLDSFVESPALTMQVVDQPSQEPDVVKAYNVLLEKHRHKKSATLERFHFYNQSKQAYVIVATGETRIYGNILLKKGVI